MVVLAALESFGSIYRQMSPEIQSEIARLLAETLNDERWRVREIVTQSYKWTAKGSYAELTRLFQQVLTTELTPSRIRGILATVAHPEILRTKEQKEFAQEVMVLAFAYYDSAELTCFSKEEKLILRKGLALAPKCDRQSAS